ncbi:DISARM system helicase DrmA [Heliomicrobium undosum]|uniref:DISARM system helicase DrmA n=1 Tax=Heliomicrobium undosum TaxID=121734 RepID=UPI001478DF88|nr:DISARM system helicase DrmA [Heliomicrobium undosum]
MEHANKVKVRNELVERLRSELIGPATECEVIGEAPGTRYLAGILWPAGTLLDTEDDEDFSAGHEGEETGSPEVGLSLIQALKPSSIGLSFVVENGTESIAVSVSLGIYKKDTGNGNWKRVPISEDHFLRLNPDGERRSVKMKFNDRVFLEWIVRPMRDRLAVSLFLVNRQKFEERASRDPFCLFQPSLKVYGTEKGVAPFTARQMELDERLYRPEDVLSDDLLFRHCPEYATGHGTAVEWEESDPLRKRASVLQTVWIPSFEIALVTPPEWTGGGSLDMNTLADATKPTELRGSLQPLIDRYSEWIERQKGLIRSLSGRERETALRHSLEWERSRTRMQQGLDLLCSPSDHGPLLAFRFANRAMALQRSRTVMSRIHRKTGNWPETPVPVHAVWRPFQMAFILQSLSGVADPDHEDRKTADLLWFPTGGGKTEAYLGLAAFAMALRRLRGEQLGERGDTGVSVIMRYTLRLLTVQQFQRAATLICACEMLRRNEPRVWGEVPFRIGLWVGEGSTPNNFNDAQGILENKETTRIKELKAKGCTPIQLVSCPWCGAPLTRNRKAHPASWFADQAKRRIVIGCSRRGCEYHRSSNMDGIPALVTDEEIYRLTPDLLIGTVDKFARLPWVVETTALFGKVKGFVPGWGFVCQGESDEMARWRQEVVNSGAASQREGRRTPNRNQGGICDSRPLLPPDLIIQDELHLITGPLGTMAGIYETAVDWLASRKIGGYSVGPKVVASTATVRRAAEQMRSLFNRNLAVFPSPGLTSGDSFFAVEQPREKKPGRLYLGIFAPGRSMKTALLRIYANLLASLPAMDNPLEDLDPYYTVVGYYNSLRELGGAVRLIEDDVKSRISLLESREPDGLFEYGDRQLNISESVPELTSRIRSGDIPAILEQLERTCLPGSGERPLDIILATNMISVGVDVGRLGLMVVTGQPKTTAEYIQATSRVGREYPGLVITLYNWVRPRDVSHYERFRAYHSAVYRYVEPTSVTPFSSRARDRALPATLITMCRLGIKELSPEPAAARFQADLGDVNEVQNHYAQRTKEVDGPSRMKETADHIEACLSRWEHETYRDKLNYAERSKGTPRLMYPLGSESSGVFPAPNSMRDVEPSLKIFLADERT